MKKSFFTKNGELSVRGYNTAVKYGVAVEIENPTKVFNKVVAIQSDIKQIKIQLISTIDILCKALANPTMGHLAMILNSPSGANFNDRLTCGEAIRQYVLKIESLSIKIFGATTPKEINDIFLEISIYYPELL